MTNPVGPKRANMPYLERQWQKVYSALDKKGGVLGTVLRPVNSLAKKETAWREKGGIRGLIPLLYTHIAPVLLSIAGNTALPILLAAAYIIMRNTALMRSGMVQLEDSAKSNGSAAASNTAALAALNSFEGEDVHTRALAAAARIKDLEGVVEGLRTAQLSAGSADKAEAEELPAGEARSLSIAPPAEEVASRPAKKATEEETVNATPAEKAVGAETSLGADLSLVELLDDGPAKPEAAPAEELVELVEASQEETRVVEPEYNALRGKMSGGAPLETKFSWAIKAMRLKGLESEAAVIEAVSAAEVIDVEAIDKIINRLGEDVIDPAFTEALQDWADEQ